MIVNSRSLIPNYYAESPYSPPGTIDLLCKIYYERYERSVKSINLKGIVVLSSHLEDNANI